MWIIDKVKMIRHKRFTKDFMHFGEDTCIMRDYKQIDKKSISIGNDSFVNSGARIIDARGNMIIRIGNNTGIQYNFTVLAGANVTIGNNVTIASDVFLSAGSHGINPELKVPYGLQKYVGEDIVIGDGAWLGEKVIILSGVHVGEKAIIGAGSVVTKDVPAYSIAVGNPAKVIKHYNKKTSSWEAV